VNARLGQNGVNRIAEYDMAEHEETLLLQSRLLKSSFRALTAAER
jgi:hypothetical protein